MSETVPKRIQLKRIKGWRKPEGAIVVSRPSIWGNPFKVGEVYGYDVLSPESATNLFRELMGRRPVDRRAVQIELAGHDLACWCPLDQPCHADVLLEIANSGGRG